MGGGRREGWGSALRKGDILFLHVGVDSSSKEKDSDKKGAWWWCHLLGSHCAPRRCYCLVAARAAAGSAAGASAASLSRRPLAPPLRAAARGCPRCSSCYPRQRSLWLRRRGGGSRWRRRRRRLTWKEPRSLEAARVPQPDPRDWGLRYLETKIRHPLSK